MLTRLCVLRRPFVPHAIASAPLSTLTTLRRGSLLPATQPSALPNYSLRRLSSTQVSAVPAPPLVPPTTRTWIDQLPAKVRPYVLLARADKPIGTMLLYWPCTWSVTMAAYVTQAPIAVPLTYLSLLGIGSFLMRSVTCTINDMVDRDLDRAVERTKNRPMARGDVTMPQAFGFVGAQLGVGLTFLTQLNWYSVVLGAAAFPLVVAYPFMKRITHWPQAVLGLFFNWGALLGWSAVTGSVDWAVCLPLFAGGACWTMVYDTIYAHQDKADDPATGIHSTALLFGDKTRPILSAFAASTVGLVGIAGLQAGMGLGFFAGLGLGATQLARILYRVDFDKRSDCWNGFVGSGWFGFWVWAGSSADYLTMLLN